MRYIKTYRNSKNLFDKNNADVYNKVFISIVNSNWSVTSGDGKTVRIPVNPSTTYSISIDSSIESNIFRVLSVSTNDIPVADSPVNGNILVSSSANNTATFTTLANTTYIILQFTYTIFDNCINTLMLCTGSVSYSYEAYNVTGWYDFCKKKTATGWADSTAQKAPF